jgi:hypothetical protein
MLPNRVVHYEIFVIPPELRLLAPVLVSAAYAGDERKAK